MAFDASRQPDGNVRVVELVEKEVPLVKPVRTREGFLMVAVEPSRAGVLTPLTGGNPAFRLAADAAAQTGENLATDLDCHELNVEEILRARKKPVRNPCSLWTGIISTNSGQRLTFHGGS